MINTKNKFIRPTNLLLTPLDDTLLRKTQKSANKLADIHNMQT